MKTIEVTGCNRCMFMRWDNSVDEPYPYCTQSDNKELPFVKYEKPIVNPDWCPLKTEPVTVKLKDK